MTSDASSRKPRDLWRLRAYPAAFLITLVAALLLATLVYDESDPSSRLGGDYPAFYAAGAITAQGDWDELYSAERQQEEQAGLIDDEGGFLYFSYPPFVAGAYRLVGGLDYRWSFLLHTGLMALALVGGVKLLWPWLASAGWPQPAIVALALSFYPILRAIPGGQNTSLSLLLLAAAARLDHDDRPVVAGVVLALLLFKPQFGVVLVPLLLVSRRWRMLGGWTGGAIVLYGLSTLLMGGAWVADWWQQASSFRDLNVAANGDNFVSVPGFMENLVGSESLAAIGFGYGLAAIFGLAVAIYWWRYPRAFPLERFALAGAAVAVAAPQTLYYDAGLLLLGVVAIRPYLSKPVSFWVAGAVAVTWLQLATGVLGWSPLGPIVWMAAAAMTWLLSSHTAVPTSV